MKLVLLASLLFLAVTQQQAITSGIQFFSLQQDKEIGAASATEAERTLPLVRDPAIESYFRSVGARLAPHSPLTGLQYRFRIVNSPNINAATFPGGKAYLDRGLIDLAVNEHELAAILAHEIAHAAARHGTRQLSGQLLVQAPASVLASLPTDEGWKEQLARLGISFGVRAPFLRYSPEQEIEANTIAVGILVKAGYSPYALSAMFDKINKSTEAEKKSLPAYAYNHPQAGDAAKTLESEIKKRKIPNRSVGSSPEFKAFRTSLAKLAFANPPIDQGPAESELTNEHVQPDNHYRLRYPEGWQVRPTGANGAIIAPVGGVQPTPAGDDVRKGVMFDLFSIPEQVTLDQATNRLITFLRQRNQELRLIPGAQSQMLMGAEPALRTVLIGNSKPDESPRRPREFVWVATRLYYGSLFYIVCVAPEGEFAALQPVFEQMIRSVQLR